MRGIQVDPDTIMLDLIEKVGPGGSFLNQSRSAALCRTEAWVPGVLDRDPYALWEKKGARSSEDLLDERVRKILDTHQAPPLAPEAVEKIKVILANAEMRERKKR
jgi:trimethylamine--corrinoid protein Co-methyltransferase